MQISVEHHIHIKINIFYTLDAKLQVSLQTMILKTKISVKH